MPLNKIMIVIDPTSDQQPAFERALESARLTGAQLHIYACVDEESGYTGLKEAREKLQPALDELSSRAQAENIEATTDSAHIKLNHQIVSVARSFSEAYGSEAHYVIAFRDLNNPPDAHEIAQTDSDLLVLN